MEKYFWPESTRGPVHRLPFGLYIKSCDRSQGNEENALQLVEKYTSIPAPLFVDSFENNRTRFLVMTKLRGVPVGTVFHRMSYDERHQFARDLMRVVKELQKIPNHTGYLFSNTRGGPIIDHRLPDGIGGPFNSEADFNDLLIHKYVDQQTRDAVSKAHDKRHESLFSHADLHLSNILLEGGRLSGIVDWECAGFMPEYWEFTKAMSGVWNIKPKEDMIRVAFPSMYEDELKAEQKLWLATP